jgi:hypothetical protein
MPLTTYDYTPLAERVTLGDVLRAQRITLGTKIALGFVVIALLLLAFVVASVNNTGLLIGLMFFGLLIIIVFAAVAFNSLDYAPRLRIQRFAAHNNMTVAMDTDLMRQPGTLFQWHIPGAPSMSLATTSNPAVEIGNFIVTDNYGLKARGTFSFLKITLPRELPHIILDARSSRALTKSIAMLPLSLYRPETVLLEGDFSDTFLIYAPQGYETDLRYLLPPDLMAYLVDHMNMYDIEIIGNHVYFYSEKTLKLTDPTVLDAAFARAHDLYRVFLPYMGQYSDEHVRNRPTITVDPAAQILAKNGFSSQAYIIIFAIILTVTWPLIHNLLYRLHILSW